MLAHITETVMAPGAVGGQTHSSWGSAWTVSTGREGTGAGREPADGRGLPWEGLFAPRQGPAPHPCDADSLQTFPGRLAWGQAPCPSQVPELLPGAATIGGQQIRCHCCVCVCTGVSGVCHMHV